MSWEVAIVPQVRGWLQELRQDDPATLSAVGAALDRLVRDGPALGPPLAGAVAPMTAIQAGLEMLREFAPGFRLTVENVERAVAMSYLRELHPGGEREPRILFAFDQGRAAVVLAAGAGEGDWARWYGDNVPLAHARYVQYLREQAKDGNA